MLAPKLIYIIIIIWLFIRSFNVSKENKMDMFYTSTKVLAPLCFVKHVALRKTSTLSLFADLKWYENFTKIGLATFVNSQTTDNSTTLGLNVLYLNARSLKALVRPIGDKSEKNCKISLLQQLAYSGNYDVVCVCETWLNNSILSSEILPNYGSIFRCDRAGKIGGGVLVAVKTGIQVNRRHNLEPENTEIVAIELIKSNSKPIVLYTFYRPPNSMPDVLQSLNNSLQSNPESSCVVVIGDFNLPSLKWSFALNTPLTSDGLWKMKLYVIWLKTTSYNNSYLAQHTSLGIYLTCCYVTLLTSLVRFPYPILSLVVSQRIITSWNLKSELSSKEPRQLNARFSITKTETLMVSVIILNKFLSISLLQLTLMTAGNNGNVLS